MTLNQQVNRALLTVTSRWTGTVTDRTTGRPYKMEYRILSNGVKQARQLRDDGTPSPFWKWEEC